MYERDDEDQYAWIIIKPFDTVSGRANSQSLNNIDNVTFIAVITVGFSSLFEYIIYSIRYPETKDIIILYIYINCL